MSLVWRKGSVQFVVVFLFHSTDNKKRILVNIFDGKWVLESQPFFGRESFSLNCKTFDRGDTCPYMYMHILYKGYHAIIFFKLGVQTLRSSGCTITFILPPLVLSLRQESSGAKECHSRWFCDKYVHQRWMKIAAVTINLLFPTPWLWNFTS